MQSGTTHVCMNACCLCASVCMYVCVHVRMLYVCTYVCMYVCACAHAECVYVRVCMYVCACVYVCVCLYLLCCLQSFCEWSAMSLPNSSWSGSFAFQYHLSCAINQGCVDDGAHGYVDVGFATSDICQSPFDVHVKSSINIDINGPSSIASNASALFASVS